MRAQATQRGTSTATAASLWCVLTIAIVSLEAGESPIATQPVGLSSQRALATSAFEAPTAPVGANQEAQLDPPGPDRDPTGGPADLSASSSRHLTTSLSGPGPRGDELLLAAPKNSPPLLLA